MVELKSISLSYKLAPLEFREKVALSDEACRLLLGQLKEIVSVEEALVLSTCNRTEVYYLSEKDLGREIIGLLTLGKTTGDDLSKYFDFDRGEQSIDHLFKVAIGLESQVIGDLQVISQVKKAYQASADAGLSGPYLHRLMHTIFFTNKRIVQQTPFKDGAASVSYATAELVKDLAANIVNPKILILGLGEIGSDVCRNLLEPGLKAVYVANRTSEKAKGLAAECGFRWVGFDQYPDYIDECDIIISSIPCQAPLIKEIAVRQMNIPGFKHFIDLSVPRSIETGIQNIPGVTLYNIDNIQVKTSKAVRKRKDSIPLVKSIIQESIEEFNNWTKEMTVSPTIKKFKDALDGIRKEEIARYLKKLGPEEAKIIDQITKGITQKIVKLPALHLKAACQRDDAENLVDVLNELFDLEKIPHKNAGAKK